MKKSLHHQDSGIAFQSNHPGCMWSVFHVLHYNRWNHVKKIIPYRKHSGGRQIAVVDPGSSTTTASIAEAPNQRGETSKQTSEVQKQSEEIPTKTAQVPKHTEDTAAGEKTKEQMKEQTSVSKPSRRYRIMSMFTDEIYRRTKGKHNRSSACPVQPPDHKKINSTQQDCKDDTTAVGSVNDKPLHTDHDHKRSPPHTPRKEMFIKAMEEPKSPMAANYLHSQQVLNSGKNGDDSNTSNQTLKFAYSNNFPPGSPLPLNNQNNSTQVLTRFKNLRQKLRHVIQEDRKEKQRILMDGFLHKVPYGQRMTKDSKETVDFMDPPGAKSTQKKFARTASLTESVEKYSRLIEHSLNKETKQQNPEDYKLRVEETPSVSKSAPKKLARIQSLPDMQYYQFVGGYTVTPNKNSVDTNASIGRSKVDEQKIQDPENQSDSTAETGGEESLGERAKSFDDLEHSAKDESRIEHEHETDYQLMLSPKMEISTPDSFVEFEDKSSPADVSEPKDSHSPAESSTTDIQNINIPGKQNHIDLLQAHVGRKESVEFNYVKDVLQVAGFGEMNFVDTWHTTGQPVDPSVFTELGGCLLEEPDSEGDKYNHLLLFDLINEVLMEIHERSFTCCPMPLTCRSEMHPMPVGYHVLEEVWAHVDRYLNWRPEFDQSLDDAVSKDLAKGDGWMNLQFDAECVGLELEDLVFDELLDELIWE